MAIEVWGLDDGYGDVKGTNGKENIYFPSNVTTHKEKFSDALSESEKKDPKSRMIVEYDKKKFLVGTAAQKQDMQSSWIGGNNKHKHPMFPALAKTALNMLGQEDVTKVDPLVLGLPVEHEEKAERRELLTKLLKKKHDVTLTMADGETYEKTIDVKDVVIVKQPFGSFCDVILDETGEVKDPDLALKFVSVVDIGAGTVNYLTLQELESISELTKHTNKGMYSAYQEIARRIEVEFDKKYPLGRLPEFIKSGFITGGHNITHIVDEVFELHAGEIMNEWETINRNSMDFIEVVIFTGGGSEVLKEHLERAVAEYAFETKFLGVHNTANGLRKYGVRQSKQKGNVVTRTAGGSVKISAPDKKKEEVSVNGASKK